MTDPFRTPGHWQDDPYQPIAPRRALPFDLAFRAQHAFDSGLAAIKAAPVAMWVGGVLMLIFESNGSFEGDGDEDTIARLFEGASSSFAAVSNKVAALTELAPSLAVVFAALLFFMFLLLGHAFIRPGFIRQMHAVHADGEPGWSQLFSGADAMLPMLGSSILQGLIMMVAILPVVLGAGAAFLFLEFSGAFAITFLLLVLAAVPLAYVYTGLVLADFRVALDGDGAFESIRSAWRLADGNRWPLFRFAFLMGLVQGAAALVGCMMLCVGMFFTVPLARSLAGVGWAEAYLLATRGSSD